MNNAHKAGYAVGFTAANIVATAVTAALLTAVWYVGIAFVLSVFRWYIVLPDLTTEFWRLTFAVLYVAMFIRTWNR